jgi:hypothetical protein
VRELVRTSTAQQFAAVVGDLSPRRLAVRQKLSTWSGKRASINVR